MAKKTIKPQPVPAVAEPAEIAPEKFYFGRENFRWMLIGLAFILAGYLLMLGPDANTVDGQFNPNAWNEEIFSFRRIRLAPLLVLVGFGVEAYAILKRHPKKD